MGADSFLTWLETTGKRLGTSGQGWRDLLIAKGVQARSPLQPFVSIQEGEDKAQVRHRRKCDVRSKGESVYCLDHSSKQVGRAALQFWFEVLKQRQGFMTLHSIPVNPVPEGAVAGHLVTPDGLKVRFARWLRSATGQCG